MLTRKEIERLQKAMVAALQEEKDIVEQEKKIKEAHAREVAT